MEIYLIIGIVCLQCYVLYHAINKINIFKIIINTIDNISIKTFLSRVDSKDENSPLVKNYHLSSKKGSPIHKKIEMSINDYLINNKGASADMSLLKNIIDRNIEKLENEVSSLTPLPLYLGLIGTMVGIIIGLWNIPSVSEDAFTEGKGIDVLIDGVKYAMIASLFGISFTSYLSGFAFRKAKYLVESNVNDFLTLLETKLLPHLKEDVSTNLTNLYHNLATFNAGFSVNVTKLQGMMNKNYDALVAQESILDNLQSVDINKLANANVKVFTQMEKLMPQFKMMGTFVEGISNNIEHSKSLSESIRNILLRTNEVHDIANYIKNSTTQATQLNELVHKHFEEIEERTNTLTSSSILMEDQAKNTVEHFKTFIEEQITALKDITLKEEDLLINAFEKNRDVLGKLNELTEIKEELKNLTNKLSNESTNFDVDKIVEAIKNRQFNDGLNSKSNIKVPNSKEKLNTLISNNKKEGYFKLLLNAFKSKK